MRCLYRLYPPDRKANLYTVRLNSRTIKPDMKRSFMRTGGGLPAPLFFLPVI
jgi:hypothetical protein